MINPHTRLVVSRELDGWRRRKSTWIILGTAFVLSLIGLLLVNVVGGDDGPTNVYLAVDRELTPQFVEGLDHTADLLELDVEFDIANLADAAAVRASVEDGNDDLGLVWSDPPVIVYEPGRDEASVQLLQQYIMTLASQSRLLDLGLTETDIADLSNLPGPQLETVNPDTFERAGFAFAFSAIAYFGLLTLLGTVSAQVAAEKANRVTEVLLPIVAPRHLLYGKVAAAVGVGAGMLLAVLTPFAGWQLIDGAALPTGAGAALVTLVPWSLGGAVVFVMLAAASASMVDKVEDQSATLMPIMLVLIGSFAIASGLTAIDNTAAKVLAVFPTTSPLILPARVAQGFSSPAEMLISAVLLAATAWASARVAAGIFGRAITHTGGRAGWNLVLRRGRDDRADHDSSGHYRAGDDR